MNRKAFTLIELLVVVAIIGILAAVGVVAYNGYTSAAKKNIVWSNHAKFLKWVNATYMMCIRDSNRTPSRSSYHRYPRCSRCGCL